MANNTTLSTALQAEQAKAAKRLALCSMALLPVSILSAWLVGNSLIPVLGAGLGIVGLGVGGLLLNGAAARTCAAFALVGQVMVFVDTFAGHPWQVDAHMLFFTVLAALVSLTDITILLMGAAVIVLHHLGLALILPAELHASDSLISDIERTLIQGAIVALEVAWLVNVVLARRRLDAQSLSMVAEINQGRRASDLARKEAEAATQRALAAQLSAEQVTADLQISREAEAENSACRLIEQEEARQLSDLEMAERARLAQEQTRVVDALRIALSALAQGDFTRPIQDELAPQYEDLQRDFNNMLASLNLTVVSALAHTAQIDDETSSINAAAQHLSGRSEHQASSMEETAAALEQITSSVRSAAERAHAARTKSKTASESAETGRKVVAAAMQTMQEIEASSVKISRITAVIDDIAFQTNLLALNAGVEAARVGEAGRGFAVVASEVRALALRSAEAAREINVLIGESSSLVKKGVTRVEETGQALVVILEQVRQIAIDVAEIANSTSEQSKGISEVNISMQSLGQLTQQIVAMFEETSAATLSLEREAAQLRDVLGQFQTDDPQTQTTWAGYQAA